jgi:hypothetical protein
MKNNASVKKIMSRGRAVIGNEFTKAFALDKPIAVIRENENAVRLTQRKLTKKMKENQVSSVIPHFNGSCQVCVSKYFGTADSVVIYNDFEKSSDVIVRAI